MIIIGPIGLFNPINVIFGPLLALGGNLFTEHINSKNIIALTVILIVICGFALFLLFSDLAGVSRIHERLLRLNDETVIAKLDLFAQREMAKFAFWQLVFTIVATIVSTFALIGLFLSLIHTRQALSLSEELGQAQTSAYVHAEKATWGDKGNILVYVKNSGQTPVRRFRISGSVKFVGHGKVSESLDFEDVKSKTWSSIAAGQTLSVALDPDNQAEILTKITTRPGIVAPPIYFEQLNTVVAGTIYYENVFGGWFKTQFAFYSDWKNCKRFRRPTAELLVHEKVEGSSPHKQPTAST